MAGKSAIKIADIVCVFVPVGADGVAHKLARRGCGGCSAALVGVSSGGLKVLNLSPRIHS